MFIPPNQLGKKVNQPAATAKHGIALKSSHIWIAQAIAERLFGQSPNINLVFYPERKTLMLAPKDDELFASLHKAKQYMLKNRSLQGDKTIAIHEILIDHDLDDSDRDLEYSANDRSGILIINL